MEFIAKGWAALKEVDRVIDYCELNDRRLIPHLRTAKENFELALEADNSNTHARFWLAKLHLKYHVPGACKPVGVALLVEAAEMGNADALYELGCQLRVENGYVQSDQQAFYYLEKAVEQLHPGALYLFGAVYLTGDCVKQDLASALWCFHRAAEKGHAGAAIAYGSLLLKVQWLFERRYSSSLSARDLVFLVRFKLLHFPLCIAAGVRVPESLTTKFKAKRQSKAAKNNSGEGQALDPVKLAKEQFQIAASAGSDLGFRWLSRLEQEEKQQLIE
ncbi:hypothetical protein Dimus_034391 [Dionaea muscipula]